MLYQKYFCKPSLLKQSNYCTNITLKYLYMFA
nr:MAG TPA: hypothetical protein [Caudoviricetes sp.]